MGRVVSIEISKLEYFRNSKKAPKYVSTDPYITAHQDPSIVEVFRDVLIFSVSLFMILFILLEHDSHLIE